MRAQRFGLVQTASQYIYLHFSICTYLERKLGKRPEAAETVRKLKQFFADYLHYANDAEKEDKDRVGKGGRRRDETEADKK